MHRFLEDSVDYDAGTSESIYYLESLIPALSSLDDEECLNSYLKIQKREYYYEYLNYCMYEHKYIEREFYVDNYVDYNSGLRLTNDEVLQGILNVDPSLYSIVEYAKSRKPKLKNVSLALNNKSDYTDNELFDICYMYVLKEAYSYHQMLNINLADAIQSGFSGLFDALKYGRFHEWYYEPNGILYSFKRFIGKAIIAQNPYSDRGIPLYYAEDYVKLIKYASSHTDFHYMISYDWYVESLSKKLLIPVKRLVEICRNEPWITYNIEAFDDDNEWEIETNNSIEVSLLNARIKDALRTLTPREEQVISLRFGLTDGIPKTLEEVGKQFHITRERIREIEAKALRKLRHPSRMSYLLSGNYHRHIPVNDRFLDFD